MAESHSFGIEPITCFTWNNRRNALALSPNNNEVHIYNYAAGRWTLSDTLKEHQQHVTGVDWSPSDDNTIVSCGADRNAYVWRKQDDGKWKPTLVILRINRAATCVKWSPQGNKFAVGSGARLISVCYFEKENDWWVSKHIKKPIRSTITCLDWHPNNILIAAGSTDFKARVFSGYIKEVEAKPEATEWGKKMTFGNLMAEFSNGGGGWVHDVSFSADGQRLVWVGHDSSVSVVNAANDNAIATVKTQFLPYTSCSWTSPSNIVVAGFDCSPMLFSYDSSGSLRFVAKLDESNKQQATSKFNALKHFKNLDSQKLDSTQETNETTLSTQHQNTITQLCLFTGNKANCSKISTVGIDGQLIFWDFKTLEASIAGLRLS